jgi:pheromone shutdown protein TraB
MTAIPAFSPALVAALAGAEARAAAAIAAAVPADVSVALADEGIALTGRSLSIRAQTDGRLRDFVGLVR